jgi:hypothetical protein
MKRIGKVIKAVLNFPPFIVTSMRVRGLRRKAHLAREYLKAMDLTMKSLGMTRQQQRQFWRDFYKYPNVRNQLFEAGFMTK